MNLRSTCTAAVFLLLAGFLILAPGSAPAQRGQRPTSPLEQILDKLEDLETDIDELRTEVDAVRREVVTCTLAEKRAGNCDRVRQTTVQACFKLDLLEVALQAQWKAELKARGEGGAGWTSGPDGKIIADLGLPLGPVPNEFGLGTTSKAAVASDVCIGIPIALLPAAGAAGASTRGGATSAAVSEGEFETLAERFEDLGAVIVPMIVEELQAQLPSGERLEDGFEMARRVADGELMAGGGDALSDPRVLEVASSLPAPGMVREGLQTPGVVAEFVPALGGTGVDQRVAAFCDPDDGLALLRSPLTQGFAEPVCDALAAVPQFDEVSAAILDIPEAVGGIVDELVNQSGAISQNPGNRFCDLPVVRNTRLCSQ